MSAVWIIEDNANYRKSTERVLTTLDESREVRSFNACEDAIEEIDAGGVADVFLMDIGLPGMDGLDGIAEVKRRLPEAIILVLTVFAEDEKIFRAIQAGASGYMLKSEPVEQLNESIEMALSGAAPINPHIAKSVLRMFASLAPTPTSYNLSEREQQVLECMTRGMGRKQIAFTQDINSHTVDYHMRRIFAKLHVNGATAAVALAIREGLVRADVSPRDEA